MRKSGMLDTKKKTKKKYSLQGWSRWISWYS